MFVAGLLIGAIIGGSLGGLLVAMVSLSNQRKMESQVAKYERHYGILR